MVLQVSKIFSNGMKVVLKEQNGRTPGLLRVFDKDGCLIANREILKSKTFDRTDALEKMTLRADNYGNLEKTYTSVVRDRAGKVQKRVHSNTDFGKDVAPTLGENDIPNGLGWMERISETEGKLTKSDKTLWDMCKQWFIAPKYYDCYSQCLRPRKNPKPMFQTEA